MMLLFRPSRPDFIETNKDAEPHPVGFVSHCSGLPGRTSLRRTRGGVRCRPTGHCSGLPGRTSLRLQWRGLDGSVAFDCSGLPGRTSLRQWHGGFYFRTRTGLFRPSRPDFIETPDRGRGFRAPPSLFRPSRPDFIETTSPSRCRG